ncbi:tail tape measure protein [Staphylococcus phage vB_StaM_SA1]|nr:tail tape measure protein [Staphylococcus phage vB_StaM_SA1]
MAKNNRNKNKKNIRQLEKNNNSVIIRNASKNTGRILLNAFIKSNPALDAVIGDSGLKLFNNEERRLKNFTEVKGSTSDLIKTLKDKSKENDTFSDSNEKLSNEKPEYESVTDYIDNSDGTKSEIISLSDKKQSKITNSPLVAMNNLVDINQRGFTGTNIALSNYSLSLQATNSLVDSGLSTLITIQDNIYQNTLLEENTKRDKQSKLHSILKGNVSLLKYLDEKTNPENLLMGMMSGEQLKTMLMGVAKNPIEFAATQGAKLAFNKLLYGDIGGYDPEGSNTNIFTRLNKRFDPENIGSLLINRTLNEDGKINRGLESLSGSDNRIISGLGGALTNKLNEFKGELIGDGKGGISLKNKRKKDTPVDFDQLTHTSINKAIPDLLSRLQGNLIAQREGRSGGLADTADLGSIFNYEKGTWEERGTARRKEREKIKDKSIFNFKDTFLGKELLDKFSGDEDRTKEVLVDLTKINKTIKDTEGLKKILKDNRIDENTESLAEIFEKNASRFNTDLFKIKDSVSRTMDKNVNSRIMSFTEIDGVNKAKGSTYSVSDNNDNVNQIKDFGDIEWKNDDLNELKKLFLEIENKLNNDFSRSNINQNKDFVNEKIDKINSVIEKGKSFPITKDIINKDANIPNQDHRNILDKINSLSNAVNKFKEYKEDPKSILKDVSSNLINKEPNVSQDIPSNVTPGTHNLNKSQIIDSNPIMDIFNSIPQLSKISNKLNPTQIDPNKAPDKTLDDLSKEEKQKKAKSFILGLAGVAFGNNANLRKDMEESNDDGALERMKQGLSTAEAGKVGENVMSQMTGSNKQKTMEMLRGSVNFGKGGEAEKSIGTKKMMNGMLDFSKMGPVLFAGTSATVLASLMKGKSGKDGEEKKGFLKSAGGFLGKAAMLGAGGFLAAKFGPALISKLLPGVVGKFFTGLPKGLMSIGSGIKNVAGKLGLGKLFKGIKGIPKNIGNVFKTVGKFGGKALGMTKDLGKAVIGKGAGIIKGGVKLGKSIGKVAAKGFQKIFNRKNASTAAKGLSKFASKATKNVKSIGKGLFSKAKGFGGKALGLLGKAKNKLFSKGAAKAGGKFALKAGLKTALPFIPVVGPIVGAALWAPDIIKTIKHPIESLKHPIKTLGSFFGIGEHPGDKVEDEAKSKEEKHTEDKTGLGRMILSTTKLMFRASPMFPLAKVGGDMFKTITDNKMKSGPKEEENIQKEMFMNSPIGSLYQIAKGGIDFSKKGGGEIGEWFSRFLVKMEEMVVAMSRMKNSSSGGSDGDSGSSDDGSGVVTGEGFKPDNSAPSFSANDNVAAMKKIPSDRAGAWLRSHQFWQPYGKYKAGFVGALGSSHAGIDIGMPTGTTVYAIVPGKVSKIFSEPVGGNYVEIKSGNIYTWYMHLSNNKMVKVGDTIKVGDKIGLSGETGSGAKGAHLHFQVMKGSPSNETAIRPEPFIWGKVSSKKSEDKDSDGDKGSNAKKSDPKKGGGASLVGIMNSPSFQKDLEKQARERRRFQKAQVLQQKREIKAEEKEIMQESKDDTFRVKQLSKKIHNKVSNYLKDKKSTLNSGMVKSSNKFSKVLFIGDEIGKDMAPDLSKLIKGIKIDTELKRSYDNGGKDALMENRNEYNRNGVAVIVQLGINGGLSTGEVEDIMSMYSNAEVFFVNSYFSIRKSSLMDKTLLVNGTNESINSVARNIINWNSIANDSLIKDDGSGYMLNNNGRMKLVRLIRDNIAPMIGGGSGLGDLKEKVGNAIGKVKDVVGNTLSSAKNIVEKAKEKLTGKSKDNDSKSKDSSKDEKDTDESSSEDSGSSSSGSSAGASEYSFKNGTWYGSITGRDDTRMDEDEQEELNDRLLKRYARIYGIDYEEAKKIDQEQQEKLKSKSGSSEESSSSGSDSGDDEGKDSSGDKSTAEISKDKNDSSSSVGNSPTTGSSVNLPTLNNSGFSNQNRNNNQNNTTNNNSSVINGGTVNQEFINGNNRVTNHYNKIVNNHKNSKIENGNSGYTYDYEKLWYSDDLVKMLANIDRNTFASTKELDRLLEELK